MFSFKCPKCGTKVFIWQKRNFKQYQTGTFYCNNCQSNLKLSNGMAFFLLYGLFCGGLLLNANYWSLKPAWISYFSVLLICFLVFGIFVKLLGRWKVVAKLIDPKQYPPRIKKLTRFAWLCLALSLAVLLSMFLIVWFQTLEIQHISSEADQVDGVAKSQLLDKGDVSIQIIMWSVVICFSIYLLLFIVSIILFAVRHRALKKLEDGTAEQQATSN